MNDKHNGPPEMAGEVREAMKALDITCGVLTASGLSADVVGSALLNLLFAHASKKAGGYDPCADHEIVIAASHFAHARLHQFLGSRE